MGLFSKSEKSNQQLNDKEIARLLISLNQAIKDNNKHTLDLKTLCVEHKNKLDFSNDNIDNSMRSIDNRISKLADSLVAIQMTQSSLLNNIKSLEEAQKQNSTMFINTELRIKKLMDHVAKINDEKERETAKNIVSSDPSLRTYNKITSFIPLVAIIISIIIYYYMR